MVDQNAHNKPNAGPEEWLSQAPRVSDALKKGVFVSVTTWAAGSWRGSSATGNSPDCSWTFANPTRTPMGTCSCLGPASSR